MTVLLVPMLIGFFEVSFPSMAECRTAQMEEFKATGIRSACVPSEDVWKFYRKVEEDMRK